MELLLVFASLVAGFLTVLAPCQLIFLPIIVGRSLTGKSYRVIAALLFSILLFTLIIEGTTSFIYIPDYIWTNIAAALIFFVGLSFIFPTLWTRLPFVTRTARFSNQILGAGTRRGGIFGDCMIGFSLGPIFSSCSPTFLLILSFILPKNFIEGLIYLLIYVAGVGVTLLAISTVGQRQLQKINSLARAGGTFKRSFGIMMLVIALVVYTGYDKRFSGYLLDIGFPNLSVYEIPVDSDL